MGKTGAEKPQKSETLTASMPDRPGAWSHEQYVNALKSLKDRGVDPWRFDSEGAVGEGQLAVLNQQALSEKLPTFSDNFFLDPKRTTIEYGLNYARLKYRHRDTYHVVEIGPGEISPSTGRSVIDDALRYRMVKHLIASCRHWPTVSARPRTTYCRICGVRFD